MLLSWPWSYSVFFFFEESIIFECWSFSFLYHKISSNKKWVHMVASSSCSKLTAFSLMCIKVHELKLLRIFLCFREKINLYMFLFLFFMLPCGRQNMFCPQIFLKQKWCSRLGSQLRGLWKHNNKNKDNTNRIILKINKYK